jgi:hypothetical protein
MNYRHRDRPSWADPYCGRMAQDPVDQMASKIAEYRDTEEGVKSGHMRVSGGFFEALERDIYRSAHFLDVDHA